MEHLPDDLEPRTQTSPSLTGGVPPIPPYNKPPVLTAIATPDPEGDDTHNVIDCVSEGEAHKALRQMGYYVSKISVRRPVQRTAESADATIWERTTETIADLYWSARSKLIELVDAFREGERMATEKHNRKKTA